MLHSGVMINALIIINFLLLQSYQFNMTAYIFVKYLHIVSIFGMISFLVAELVLVKQSMNRGEIKQLSKLDGFYGLMSILAVGAGFTLWFGVGKPAEFYANVIFYIKIGMVSLVGILSIWPTVFFIKQRKGEFDELVTTPNYIRKLIIFQLALLAVAPFLAITMAQGVRI